MSAVIRQAPIHKQANNQSGLTLVEILIAVTIMSVLSVTIMALFMSGTEKSTQDSKVIIAANLARSKLSELRETFSNTDNYTALRTYFATPSSLVLKNALDIPADLHDQIGTVFEEEINNTTYRYLIQINNRNSNEDGTDSRKSVLSAAFPYFSAPNTAMENYMIKVKVTVYWGVPETDNPPDNRAATLDSYLVNRR